MNNLATTFFYTYPAQIREWGRRSCTPEHAYTSKYTKNYEDAIDSLEQALKEASANEKQCLPYSDTTRFQPLLKIIKQEEFNHYASNMIGMTITLISAFMIVTSALSIAFLFAFFVAPPGLSFVAPLMTLGIGLGIFTLNLIVSVVFFLVSRRGGGAATRFEQQLKTGISKQEANRQLQIRKPVLEYLKNKRTR